MNKRQIPRKDIKFQFCHIVAFLANSAEKRTKNRQKITTKNINFPLTCCLHLWMKNKKKTESIGNEEKVEQEKTPGDRNHLSFERRQPCSTPL